MHTLNLGILAHVDAGKTSLTERLLHAAHAVDELGSVDDGSTRTDSLDLERLRGITIKAAVATFDVDDVTVNLIDTPGHPDFIAEVERALGVLDGAVLVVSAVEGVQAQTRILMRTLQRLRIPTLIFVNKIDRGGARYESLLHAIGEKLTPAHIATTSTDMIGTHGAVSRRRTGPAFRSELAELLAEHDDALLAAYVDGTADAVPDVRLRGALAAQTRSGLVHPVLFGSAITGAGTDALIGAITELLPTAPADVDGPVSGTVFKVERGPAGEKTAYVRMFSGTVRVRDTLSFGSDGTDGKVTGIRVFEHGAAMARESVSAGRIATVRGLSAIRVGDAIGAPGPARTAGHHFAPPTLETIVVARRPGDRGALHAALTQLAEQDPLIRLRRDELRQEISVSLYGEVQKEVVQATLADEFGIGVDFCETTTIHVERLVGTGTAVEFLHVDPNPFLATVGLRAEPAPPGCGVEFRLEVELGSMPYAFIKAVEETVRETLHQGLYGWEIPDCVVTLTHSGYAPRQSHAHAVFDKSMSSTAGDFRHLTPLVLMSALRQAGTEVHEPLHDFRLEIPADMVAAVLPMLTRHRAVPRVSVVKGSSYVIQGELPAAEVHGVERQLPRLTSGEGVLESSFARYRPCRGVPPTRPRSDHDPLDRRAYLLRVVRRTGGRDERR
ncbi:TetM/TetW/TetO/TetS family tetracycline resistance ribosomal protection protein [Streptomyces sp. ISL-10]|uniref:elongation factor G n=1 Tax=Streptomyces sp. ISL-10 TaxID=2819172 RepID=UPI001BEC8A0E|nr:TetM/TetW/TetO/TetS family tetracycline resistance ribosomal protection protein [Streptomyces sp. ISL-10]MBT2365988.1 TetM/TetW/TetO/TetS family tetracycline resistance ribosomal protection protein [Streptomyces sp. ISL-10]